MKTTLYSLSPIRTILIKAPLTHSYLSRKRAHSQRLPLRLVKQMEVSPSPFFVFQWIIRRKKSLLSGLKCNGFIKIALSGFRPWWHAVHSFCLNCFVFVWILYVNNYEKLNILSTFAFGYTFVIIHIWCRVDLWRYVIFFKLDEEHMHIVEVLGALQL